MQLQDIFQKKIGRPIQAVIQAEQHNNEIRYNELEEFVLTTEGEKQLKDFLNHYIKSKDAPTTDTAVWIAGFFGSGKSHFMKIIGYMLENKAALGPEGIEKSPADFLKEKTTDSELQTWIDEAVKMQNQTITFNISAQSTMKKNEKSGIAEILYNKFNEMIGLSKYAKIAQGEHHLLEDNKYEAFIAAFKESTNQTWSEGRDKVKLYSKKAEIALQMIGYDGADAKSLFMSEVDLTIEDIVKLISNYAKNRNPDYRLIFLIDEISQYIGNNSQLILELQTIVELFGSIGLGQVWVVVTSQKSLNDVTKDGKEDDYSKIQARFKSRINLTSSDTDEVIKKRLLEKKPEAITALQKIYQNQKDLLQTTLAFKNDTTKFSGGYQDEEEFIAMYPLVPYEIPMLQAIFQKIREQGEGGASTSQGERTIIAAAQLAILQSRDEQLGSLVSMAEYYPSIEQQLDPVIVNTMKHASDLIKEGKLETKDLPVLHLLYFVRGLENTTVRSEIDNLAVMLITNVQGSLSQTATQVETSLERLVRRLFVSKKLDGTYEFLTSEERKANEAIKQIEVEDSEIESLIQKHLFTTVIPVERRSITVNGRVTRFEAYYNQQREGGKQEALRLRVETGTYQLLATGEGVVRICLPEHEYQEVFDLLNRKLKIDRYVRNARANPTVDYNAAVVEKKRFESNELDSIAVERLKLAVKQAGFLVNDEELQIKSGDIYLRLEDAFKTLIAKTYTKMQLVTSLALKTYKEDWDKLATGNFNSLEAYSPSGCYDVNQFLNAMFNKNVVTLEMLVDRYTDAPYGWEERDTIGVVLALYADQKLKLRYSGKPLTPATTDFVAILDRKSERSKILLEQVASVSQEELNVLTNTLRRAFDIHESIKGETIEEIVHFIDEQVNQKFYEPLSEIEHKMNALQYHPGLKDVVTIQASIGLYKAQPDEKAKLAWFQRAGVDTFVEASETLSDLSDFYLEGRDYMAFKEIEHFANIHRQDINLATLSADSIQASALQFKKMIESDRLPGQNLRKLQNLQQELIAYWKKYLEIERQRATVSLKIAEQQLDQLPQDSKEQELVIEQAKMELVSIEQSVIRATEIPQLTSMANQATFILSSTKQKLNELVQQESEEYKSPIVFYGAGNVMQTLFAKQDRFESERDIEEALTRLRAELLAKLSEGTIVRER
ncbi:MULTISPECIES: BREX system P-loop protein BrxC [Saccharibacillus]|uniref:BREX system P-loop protein BrxC n=1 Tax=Saccharibacillus TaxID=456492 RepID=UPI00123B9C5A|nr:BREX system P-loop protein BrxC [Saccharibacillus sp. WB 17]MWJ31310.1 BREX system P-loop protein BrxC [Saccharibacillus sp. WB 17]